jgi:hypothetical protein
MAQRHVGGSARSTARHGATESRQRHRHPLVRQALHALAVHVAHAVASACAASSGHSPSQCQLPMSKVMPSGRPARSATAKKVCSAGSVPAARSGRSRSRARCASRASTFRLASRSRSLRSRRWTSSAAGAQRVAACMPRLQRGAVEPAAFGPQAFGARSTRARPAASTGSSRVGVAQHLAAHFDRIGAGFARASRANQSWPWRRTSAAPKDDSEIRTSASVSPWCELRIWPRNWRVRSSLRRCRRTAAAAPARRCGRRP